MNYILFKEKVVKEILNYMPEKYTNYEVKVRAVNKVNHTLDCMVIAPPRDVDLKVLPTMYINYMYDHYLDCDDISEVLRETANSLVKWFESQPEIIDTSSPIIDLDKIVMTLVNTAQNKRMLISIPSREFHDLSIIYRCIVKTDENEIGSVLIDNGIMDKLGLTEEKLFKLSIKNTRALLPPVVNSMSDVIKDMLISSGAHWEAAEMMIRDISMSKAMYVITNTKGINGAVNMLYEDILYTLANKINSDLYILPSSVHEIIAVSTFDNNPNTLANLVREINLNEVAIGERLSNQVYYYCKVLRKLVKATDTLNKLFC